MSTRTVRFRFVFTLATSLLRSLLAFVTGIVVARGLGPEQFGNFTYLLSTFVAMRQLLDMGSSTAFYTFLSQRPRGWQFIRVYVGWQLLQLTVPMIVIGLVFPESLLSLVWADQSREMVLLALGAAFAQNNAWLTVTQIAEARRKNQLTQSLGLAIAAIHGILILTMAAFQLLSAKAIFAILIVEYVLAASIAAKLLAGDPQGAPGQEASPGWRRHAAEYVTYCRPLVLYVWIGFAYSFADTWLLRHFGGAAEQGFFAISAQMASISLLTTTAMMPIFWKEIAEATDRGDMTRVNALFRRTVRFLFAVSAFFGAFLAVWSREITATMLGQAFTEGSLALAIMLIYHTYASIGQTAGTVFLASGQTRPQAIIGIAFMLLSLPISYFIQAPPHAMPAGLGAGAIGMALKLLGLSALNINVMLWWLARSNRWNHEWRFQFLTLGSALILAALSREAALVVAASLGIGGLAAMALAAPPYLAASFGLLWWYPDPAGSSRTEIVFVIRRLLGRR